MFKKKRRFKFGQKNKTSWGFTIPEILATLVIAGIITSALLGAMVQLSQADKREAILTQTQQEMQMALNYISDDLRQAAYIYNDNVYISQFIPDNFGTNTRVILAFWKPEPVDETALNSLNCTLFSTGIRRSECRVFRQKRFAYSLVVYLQGTGTDSRWRGRSAILRYSLPKYSDVSTMTWTQGFYTDPGLRNNFPTWPKMRFSEAWPPGDYIRPVSNANNTQVVVDYVDSPAPIPAVTVPACPTTPTPTSYTRLPDATATTSNSFFFCVRNIDNSLGRNQDVIIYLRGNAIGRNGIIAEDPNVTAGYNRSNTMPTLQTQVTLRGVVDKFNN